MQIPSPFTVRSIVHETDDVYTLTLQSSADGRGMAFLPGQFNMLYQYGIGEAAISISGDPQGSHELVHTIRAVGSVTNSMRMLKIGDEIGVRGPYGGSWPLIKTGCDVVVIAGGIGLAPLRPALIELVRRKERYGDITLLFGARGPKEIIFHQDLKVWEEQGIKVRVTVDHADVSWSGRVGVVTTLIKTNVKNPANTLFLICGPEVMIKFAVHELLGLNVNIENIYMSLERNMQCAVGVCGRCQYGPYFLCKDGPVFSYEQLKHWLMIKEL